MADGKSNKKNKQDDEIDFLLSNVNEDSQTQPKRVKHKSEETPITSTSSYTNVSIDQENEETNEETGQQEWMSLFSLKPGNDNLLYLVLGLVALVIVATLIINFGVFVSAPVVIFVWFFGWFGVCCGGFFCISRRPKAIHICNGATVGLVFGILAMVSFSIVKDIVDRPVYNYIDVTAIPDFDAQDGSILYFANGAVDKQYSGQLSIKEDSNCNGENCALVYLCVAPIIELSQFNISASIVDYWAGCQVSQVDTDCSSQYFLNSDCYKAWSQELLSGFAYGRDGRISEGFIDASEMTAKKFGLITTNTGNQNSDGMVVLNQTNVVVVLWSSDPEQEAAVFWTLGWFLVISAPFVYCIYSILYAVLCKQRIQRSTDYEEIQ